MKGPPPAMHHGMGWVGVSLSPLKQNASYILFNVLDIPNRVSQLRQEKRYGSVEICGLTCINMADLSRQ